MEKKIFSSVKLENHTKTSKEKILELLEKRLINKQMNQEQETLWEIIAETIKFFINKINIANDNIFKTADQILKILNSIENIVELLDRTNKSLKLLNHSHADLAKTQLLINQKVEKNIKKHNKSEILFEALTEELFNIKNVPIIKRALLPLN